MQDLHGRVGGINTLAAGAAGAAHGNFEFTGINFDIHFPGFWQNGHCGGGSMDAAAGFGGWNALDSMHSAFKFEVFENIFAADQKQLAEAKAFIAELQNGGRFSGRAIATTVESAGPFFEAEAYHQDYHAKHGGSCSIGSGE